MSNPSSLQACVYESESAWAENVTTFTTLRIPTIGQIDTSSIVHEKLATDKTVQYRSDGSDPVLGCQGGSITMETYLTGHGSTTAGATTITAYETFLGRIFGGTAAVSQASGTTLTGGTATVPTTTSSGTLTAGSVTFLGIRGDGKGEGQGYAVSGHSTNSLTLLNDMTGTPANTNLCSSAGMNFLTSSPTATAMTGTRFLVQSANLQYRLHGCFPSAGSITGLNAGELPKISHTWGISAWGYSTATFPSTVSTETAQPGPVASGSLFVNTVGTSTSSIRTLCRNFQINWTMGCMPLEGPGGVFPYQKVVGAIRTPDVVELQWTEDADATTLTPILAGYGTATARKHVLYTLSTADGSRVAFYFPSVAITNVAVQEIGDGQNRLTIKARALVGPNLATELTRSPMRIAFG